ncbi:peptidoglycan editing factor PgeF [uncultured Cetobacterium sp.]|uniref:peptidoglycan editing factor PgeF n=1 Tax=uncultured Cetobacterium sp. TaxID=527638 RepID=UPI002615FB32|nr:peptidoglycan editing factor PgeF [uncultured Cetobacterium sp.]
MFVDKGLYFEIEEFSKKGIKAIYTTAEMGNFQEEADRKRAINILKLQGDQVYTGYQTHSENIVAIDKNTVNYTEDTDGFITDRDDVVIFTRYADCLPIYFLDLASGAFGCVHSGWLGSYKKIVLKTVEKFQTEYRSELENLLIGFGIGISQINYEVGVEFLEKFKFKFTDSQLKDVFLEREGKIFFDNQQFNYNILLEKGIKKEQIIRNDLCTFQDKRFHSYRRDKKDSGRNAAYIFIDKNEK